MLLFLDSDPIVMDEKSFFNLTSNNDHHWSWGMQAYRTCCSNCSCTFKCSCNCNCSCNCICKSYSPDNVTVMAVTGAVTVTAAVTTTATVTATATGTATAMVAVVITVTVVAIAGNGIWVNHAIVLRSYYKSHQLASFWYFWKHQKQWLDK